MTTQPTRPGEGDRKREFEQEMLRRVERSGSVKLWPMSTAPVGWIECDGSAVSRVGYRALFALLGTTYGVGDGSTTFELPDWAADAPSGAIYIMKV